MLRVKQQGVPHALLDITARREQEATPATGLFVFDVICYVILKYSIGHAYFKVELFVSLTLTLTFSRF